MMTIDLDALAHVTGGDGEQPPPQSPPVDCSGSKGFINFCGGKINIGNTNGDNNRSYQWGPFNVALPPP